MLVTIYKIYLLNLEYHFSLSEPSLVKCIHYNRSTICSHEFVGWGAGNLLLDILSSAYIDIIYICSAPTQPLEQKILMIKMVSLQSYKRRYTLRTTS